jgi:translation elongation factor EF-G
MSNKEYRDAIEDVLRQREKVARMQEGIKDAVKSIAERFDRKPAQVNKVIVLVEKEREKGGVLEEQHNLLDDAESVLL